MNDIQQIPSKTAACPSWCESHGTEHGPDHFLTTPYRFASESRPCEVTSTGPTFRSVGLALNDSPEFGTSPVVSLHISGVTIDTDAHMTLVEARELHKDLGELLDVAENEERLAAFAAILERLSPTDLKVMAAFTEALRLS